MKVKAVTLATEGQYTCNATNSLGYDDTTTQAFVYCMYNIIFEVIIILVFNFIFLFYQPSAIVNQC